jgi:arsenate reductase
MPNKELLIPSLQITVNQLTGEFSQIPEHRKKRLRELTDFIRGRIQAGEKIFLNFICTHNSRRSHMAQLWAQLAALYFEVANVECFSGGTEATAFNPAAVKAMQDAGFEVSKTQEGKNPLYRVSYSNSAPPMASFSKKYDDPMNPVHDFAAVMTCAHADESCPLVPGARARIAITYDDPKEFDGTGMQESKYRERAHEIGREMLFVFAQLGH